VGRRLIGGPGADYKYWFFQIWSKLDSIQNRPSIPKLKNFEIKYGAEGFELRKNCLYWNFSRFETEVELKFGEASRC
jgi:hypothetical protein